MTWPDPLRWHAVPRTLVTAPSRATGKTQIRTRAAEAFFDDRRFPRRFNVDRHHRLRTTSPACSRASSPNWKLRRKPFRAIPGTPRRRRRRLLPDREADFFERGVNFSHVTGNPCRPRRPRHRPNWRPRLGGNGRLAGAASAQSLLPDGPHERALLRRIRKAIGIRLVVRWRHGPDALLRLQAADVRHFHATCRMPPAPFGDDVARATKMVRRVLLPQTSQRTARRRRRFLRRSQGRKGGGSLRALLFR